MLASRPDHAIIVQRSGQRGNDREPKKECDFYHKRRTLESQRLCLIGVLRVHPTPPPWHCCALRLRLRCNGGARCPRVRSHVRLGGAGSGPGAAILVRKPAGGAPGLAGHRRHEPPCHKTGRGVPGHRSNCSHGSTVMGQLLQ